MGNIYQMPFEDFKTLCWDKWGIMVSQSWPTDEISGAVKDRRKNVYTIKFPSVKSETDIPEISFIDIKEIKTCSTLREAIWTVSKKKKMEKIYFFLLEQAMEGLNKK